MPHNSSFAAVGALSATGSANPTILTSGSTTLLTVTVTPGASPNSTGISVTANLSAIGGTGAQTFYDDGTHGDATAGDNIFSFSVTDAQLRSASASISLTVNLSVPTVAIDVIQGVKSTTTGPSSSSYVGKIVQTFGIVTPVISNAFFIQAPDGQDDGNPLTPEGIDVFTSSMPTVSVGDSVTVTGTVQTFPALSTSHTPALRSPRQPSSSTLTAIRFRSRLLSTHPCSPQAGASISSPHQRPQPHATERSTLP